MTIDTFALQIAWNGLCSICDETFLSLMRASFSTNIKERHDHSTAILDARGRLIAQAEMSLPIHLASMTGMITNLLKQYADDMHPGDIYCANDPHTAGGTHLPDINLALPVFCDGKLAGFIANIAHHADIGGTAAGSMSGGLTEIWQEGLRIPVIRLAGRGEVHNDILRLMLLNMRLPHERMGDLNAQIAACRLGETRLSQMLRELGPQKLASVFDEIITRSEQRMRAAISAFPDGEYQFEDVLDDDGAGTQDLAICLKVTKNADRMHFDFTGSAPQARGNINLTFNAVQSAVFYSLKALLDPELPNNEGVFAPVEITAPEGSLLNCLPPAAVALRANTSQRVVDVVIGALAPGIPERAIAAANGANTSAVFAGKNPEDGTPYVYLETLGGGMGARATKDGKDGVQVHITNTSNLPIEAIEMEYPLRVLEYSLRQGSGGAGRQRGGMGLRRIVTPVGHDAVFSGVGERFSHAPWGLKGGEPGATGQFHMVNPSGKQTRLANKSLSLPLAEGHSVIIETPGAGGYGKPDNS